jgi:hypothetical protein
MSGFPGSIPIGYLFRLLQRPLELSELGGSVNTLGVKFLNGSLRL